MADQVKQDYHPLRIIHVLRAPLGGLFRHVLDLSREQARRGHAVGLIVDASTGSANADRALAELSPSLQLGLSRVAMRRNPHPSDLLALAHVLSRLSATTPDIVHGHGSKGGVFARVPGFLQGAGRVARVYTPHGGSLNHHPGSAIHRAYMGIESLLGRRTDMLLFESAFIGQRYGALVGEPAGLARVVHNGISRQEFEPVIQAPDAAEFVYVGELRAAKGIDVMLQALSETGRRLGTAPRAVLVGTGPDRTALQRLAAELGLADRITFAGPLPARRGFALGRTLVVPSRAESLPYIVLEAAGARIPLIATDVGGIPEIFGPYRDRLIPCDDVDCLVASMTAALQASPETRAYEAKQLARYVQDGFSIATMVDAVIAAYRDAVASKVRAGMQRGTAIALSQ